MPMRHHSKDNSMCFSSRKVICKKSVLYSIYQGLILYNILVLVGVTGFEPAASWSRTKRTTKLCHTPRKVTVIFCFLCDW